LIVNKASFKMKQNEIWDFIDKIKKVINNWQKSWNVDNYN
jgi:ATP phosphoribosyltransferase